MLSHLEFLVFDCQMNDTACQELNSNVEYDFLFSDVMHLFMSTRCARGMRMCKTLEEKDRCAPRYHIYFKELSK